jgi:predicted transposase/invertase (TIGR01784 family)
MLFPQAPEYHLSFRLRADQRDLVFTNDLQFHLLELPKFTSPSDNVKTLPPLERWLYFLRHAEELEATELTALLVEAEYQEATEVLEMISRSPEDRRFYEARQKFLHDEEARLIHAENKGREKGREEGALIGKIQQLQDLLDLPQQPISELSQLDSDDLGSLLQELQQRIRSRNG